MALDLSSFKKAVASLDRALKVASSDKFDDRSEDEQEVIKAGVIQNFEFTYELCWKFMKRWLEQNMGATYVDGITRRELFRLSVESNLITDVDQWMEYHNARNETSHTYDRDAADEIFQVAKTFVSDARMLMEAIEEKND